MNADKRMILDRAAQIATLAVFLFQFTIMSRDSGDVAPILGIILLVLVPLVVLLGFRKKLTLSLETNPKLVIILHWFSFLGVVAINYWILLSVPNWRNFYPRQYGGLGQIDLVINGLQFNWIVLIYCISGVLTQIWFFTTTIQLDSSKPRGGKGTIGIFKIPVWIASAIIACIIIAIGCFLTYTYGYHVLFWFLGGLHVIVLISNASWSVHSFQKGNPVTDTIPIQDKENGTHIDTWKKIKAPIGALPRWALGLLLFSTFTTFTSMHLASMPTAFHAMNSWYWPRLAVLYGLFVITCLIAYYFVSRLKTNIKYKQTLGIILWLIGSTITTICFYFVLHADRYEFFLTPISAACFSVTGGMALCGFLLIIKENATLWLFKNNFDDQQRAPITFLSSSLLFSLIWVAMLGLLVGGYLGFTPMHFPEYVGGAPTNDSKNMEIVIYVFIAGLIPLIIVGVVAFLREKVRVPSNLPIYAESRAPTRHEVNWREKGQEKPTLKRIKPISFVLSILFIAWGIGIFSPLYAGYNPRVQASGNTSGAIQLNPWAFGVCHSDHGVKMDLLEARASRAGGWVASYSLTEDGMLDGFTGNLTIFNWSRFDTAAAHYYASGRHFLPSIGPQLIELPVTGYDYLRGQISPAGYPIPENMAVYLKWLDACVRRYYWVLPDWEIGNEPNLRGFWPGSDPSNDEKVRMQEWCEIFCLSCEVIRNVSAELEINGSITQPLRIGTPGTSGDAVNWHWAMMTYRDLAGTWYNQNVDFIAFHPYASEHTWDEAVMAEKVFEVAAKIGFNGTYMITEYGYMADWNNRDESFRLQAHNMVQSYTIHLSQGIEQVYWYAETDPSGHTLTYTAEDGSGRIWLPPAAFAFRTMSRLLTNGTAYPNLASFSGINTWYPRSLGKKNPQSHYAYSFVTADNKSLLLILWKERGPETARIYLGVQSGISTAIHWSIYADESWPLAPVKPTNGLVHVRVELDHQPQILQFPLVDGEPIPEVLIVIEPGVGTIITMVAFPMAFLGIIVVNFDKRFAKKPI